MRSLVVLGTVISSLAAVPAHATMTKEQLAAVLAQADAYLKQPPTPLQIAQGACNVVAQRATVRILDAHPWAVSGHMRIYGDQWTSCMAARGYH